jgi:3'-phosphoadenosine 5'-phosphosulfate sulfotransferase (PAPS reductase)/FAD synthetase
MIKVVVPISGGKDSQSCLKLALQKYAAHEILGLFCDTQFEHPKTYAHIDWMRKKYGVRIQRITAGSVEDKILKYKRFPGGGARHCTEELKIVPAKKFYKALALLLGAGFEVWVGVRSEESRDREKRYSGKVFGNQKRVKPLRAMTLRDVRFVQYD